MAFNGIARIYLKAGEATWVWVTHNGVYQSDYGAQWIMAHPEMNTGYYPQFGTAEFQVDHHRKKIFFNSGTGQQHATYSCLVTNVGSMSTFFSMQGGGNV